MYQLDRGRVTYRYRFSEEDEEKILKKTGGKCAHCGKPIFAIPHIENTVTIDHFIPLAQGGLNRDDNFVPLCRPCNEAKADRIVEPESYLRFIKPDEKGKVCRYYDSYIHSFKYFSEKNLLAEDSYSVELPIDPGNGKYIKGMPKISYTVQKAVYSDLDDLYDYYVKYLKKHGCLDSEELAHENIEDWYSNSCIYFVKKNGDIKLMTVFDIVNCNLVISDGLPKIKRSLRAFALPYYVRPEIGTLCRHVLFRIPEKISEQQGLDKFPVIIDWLNNESMPAHIRLFSGEAPDTFSDDKRIVSYVESFGESFKAYTKEDIEKVNRFFGSVQKEEENGEYIGESC